MRFRIFIFFILLSQFSSSQSTLTKDQINRLADAGKVYGYLKYYHPWLQYKNINWDSAFAATVPDIMTAKNKSEYKKSLEKLFSIINDPVTAVIQLPKPTTAIRYSDLVIADSIMVITRDDYRAIVDEDTTHRLFTKAISQLGKAKAVIFDLRPDKETFLLNEVPLEEIFRDTEILTKLFSGILTLPAIRSVAHNAFLGEQSLSNSDYQSPFMVERKYFEAGGERNVPIVFIINKYSELPLEALALQSTGKAAIIQEEGAGEIGIVPDEKFWIADSVLIRARTGEIIDSENGLGFHPNLIIPEAEDRNIAIEKAKEMLKAGIRAFQQPKIIFSGFNSSYTNNSFTNKSYPSVGERVLAIAKIYTVLKYFYPNKHLWTHDWDSVYLHFLPRFVLAKDSLEYVRSVMELYANIQDGHGSVVHPLVFSIVTSPGGIAPPFQVRIIENQLVITRIFDDSLAAVLDIKRGDIILEKDGINVLKDIDDKRKLWSASNYDAQSGYMTGMGYPREAIGKVTQLKLKEPSGKIKNIQLPRLRMSGEKRKKANDFVQRGNDLPMMYLIKKDIGYVNLGLLRTINVDSMFNMFKNTKAIIFDLRNNANETARIIALRLSEKNKFGGGKKNLPGWDLVDFKENKRKEWIYKGKTVCLMHENTQSHGEVSVMNLKNANATLIGNHTAGANGNTESFFVPGGIRLRFSAFSTSMQGKGIQPDILVTPTIKGIQKGSDEILERAVKFLETGK